MESFLKRNFVAVLGISLPLLLIASLLLLHGFTRMLAEPPAHSVLYVSFEPHFARNFFDIDIDDAGRLQIGFRRPENPSSGAFRRPADATLALFDARVDRLDTFDVDAPDDPPPGQSVRLEVPEALARRHFVDDRTAPDGYRFERSDSRSGGLLREIFSGGGRARHHRLVRDGVSYSVPDIDPVASAYHAGFVGWAVDPDE